MLNFTFSEAADTAMGFATQNSAIDPGPAIAADWLKRDKLSSIFAPTKTYPLEPTIYSPRADCAPALLCERHFLS